MSQAQEKHTPHSPLPWKSVYPVGSKQRVAAVTAGDHYVCLNAFHADDLQETVDMHKANADLIVRAVNCHEELARAARIAFEAFDNRYDGAPDSRCGWMVESMQALQAALAKAESR